MEYPLGNLLWGGMEQSLKQDMMPEELEQKRDMSRQHVCWREGQFGLYLTVQKLR